MVLELDGDLESSKYILHTAGYFRAYAVSWKEHHSVFESGKVTQLAQCLQHSN